LISQRSYALAGKTDMIQEETMHRVWVTGPTIELGTSPELDEIMTRMKQKGGKQAMNSVTVLLNEVFEPLPSCTCSYICSILVK
jgi:hypothetical protein